MNGVLLFGLGWISGVVSLSLFALWKYGKSKNDYNPDFSIPSTNKVERVEVIDSTGRVFSHWKNNTKTSLDLQDEGRTLKVFIQNK